MVDSVKFQLGSQVGGAGTGTAGGHGGKYGSGTSQYGNLHHPELRYVQLGAGVPFGPRVDAEIVRLFQPPPTKNTSACVSSVTLPELDVVPHGVARIVKLDSPGFWKNSMCTTRSGGVGFLDDVQLPLRLHNEAVVVEEKDPAVKKPKMAALGEAMVGNSLTNKLSC